MSKPISKIPYQLKANQDRSLTSKHIDALMKLEDTVLENEKLKSKVDLLEKELSSCLDLHDYAREAQKSSEKAQQEYEEKARMSAKEHIHEMETHKRRFEKNILQCQMDTEALEREILCLQATVSNLQANNDKLTSELQAHIKIEDEMEKTSSIIETSKIIIQQLSDQLGKCTGEIKNLLSTETSLKKKIIKFEAELNTVSTQLEKEKVKNKRLANESILLEEINNLTLKMDAVQLENKDHIEQYQYLTINNLELMESLKKLQKDFEILKIERYVLSQSLMDLKLENDLLKEKHQNVSNKTQVVTDEKPRLKPISNSTTGFINPSSRK